MMQKPNLNDLKKRLISEDRVEKNYLYALLIAYSVILIWIIVFKCNQNEELNIERNLSMSLWERFTQRKVPFQALYSGLFQGRINELLAAIFNIICFIPIGALLNFLLPVKRGLIISALSVLCVEIFQLFSGFGGFDYTDIILNVLGVYLGYIIAIAVAKKITVKTTNIISFSLLTPLCIFAIVVLIRTIIYFPI